MTISELELFSEVNFSRRTPTKDVRKNLFLFPSSFPVESPNLPTLFLSGVLREWDSPPGVSLSR